MGCGGRGRPGSPTRGASSVFLAFVTSSGVAKDLARQRPLAATSEALQSTRPIGQSPNRCVSDTFLLLELNVLDLFESFEDLFLPQGCIHHVRHRQAGTRLEG